MISSDSATSIRPQTSDRAPGALWLILAFGLFARLLHWWTVRDLPFFAQLIMDSQEYDRWATEIFQGSWLGTETFFQAPLYPYLLAILYSVFGHSYDAIYLFQIVVSGIAGYGLYRTGVLLHDQKLGLSAAGLFAGFAVLPFYDVQLLKESPAVSVTCLLLWAFVSARSAGEPNGTAKGRWLCAGVATGTLILLRENALLLLPLFALLTLDLPWTPPGRRSVGIRRAGPRFAFLLLGTFCVLLPVAGRNWVVGGEPLPTTFQGGTNFYIGNNPEADGTYRPIVKGKQIPVYERNEPIRLAEAAVGRSLTPAEVSSYWLGQSLSWAKEQPIAFAALQLRKLGMYWRWYEWPDAVDYYFVRSLSPVLAALPFELGSLMLLALVGAWRVRRQLLGPYLPAAVFILGWMTSTVIFFIFSRYRLPMTPALILFAAVPVRDLWQALRSRDRRAVLWGALLMASAVAAPRLGLPEPRMDLTHYNLGVVFQQGGDPARAEHHFRETLALDPDHFLAAMNLGRLAADRRDWPAARQWLLRAEAAEPEADDVLLNLGAVHMALGDPDRAKTYLLRASELNRTSPGISHNLSRVELSLWRQGRGSLERALELNQKVLNAVPDHPQASALRQKLLELEHVGLEDIGPVPPGS